MTFGNRKQDSIPTYPDNSIQGILDPTPWWQINETSDYRAGQLVRVFLPHVDQIPYTVTPVGRAEPTEHKQALVKIEPLRITTTPKYPKLPVAALPQYDNEVRTLYRAKKRWAIIISEGGPEIPHHLRTNKPKWQTAPTVLVAPYYGADEGGGRAGFSPEFLRRVRCCEYPQYVWDKIPITGTSDESILRLDHIQPVGRHYNTIEVTKYCLSFDALEILYDWLEWLVSGIFSEKNLLAGVREDLLKLS